MAGLDPSRFVSRDYDSRNSFQKKGQELGVGSRMMWNALTRKQRGQWPVMVQIGVFAGTMAGALVTAVVGWNINNDILGAAGFTDGNAAHVLTNDVVFPIAGMIIGAPAGGIAGVILHPFALGFAKSVQGAGFVLEKSGDAVAVASRRADPYMFRMLHGRSRGPWDSPQP